MTRNTIHTSFAGGEISPSLWGRVDLAKFQVGGSTVRNMFVNYRGGASSRPGLAWVGQCLQAFGTPPRIIEFQYNINQGFVLEFGDNIVVRAVTGTADAGGLVRLTLASTRGLMTGNTMVVTGIVGTTEANGTWVITVIDATHVTLTGTTYANAYVSGGSTSTSAGYMRVVSDGAYVVEDSNAITAITRASPGVFSYTNTHYTLQNNDWIFIENVGGMTNFNDLIWIVKNATSTTFTVTDLFGNAIDTTSFSAYTSGGILSRIYTAVSPYAAVDLPFLKFTQNKNTMSLACVNQDTSREYPPYDLTRVTNTNWVFTVLAVGASIAAPANLAVTAQSSTTPDTWYSYVVTAVDADTGEESIASTSDQVENNDISVNAGSNSMTWDAVSDAGSYNVYRATPSYNAMVPAGVLYGYVGTALGLNFVDTNIIADFTKVPPVHQDPFSGSSNKPGTVAYYQQRRVYANTLNKPDTYFMSQPGAYTNFDSSIPISDSDAIIGAPWAQQINGIQFMQPMTNGLIILTGSGAWLLNGGTNSTITPSSQTATSQAYNGCNDHIPPIVVNFDILYVQSKGSIVRDLSYNFFANIFTGTDMTILSNHLFNYHQLIQWAYAEEPYKLVWVVRDDGVMLSLTYLKEQDVYAWARHDTNGFFVSVCSVTEPPVDAVYVIVQRYIQGQWLYYHERMDNRNWQNAEDCFCVDAGLSYPMSFPNATLTPAAANGTDNISSVNLIAGGSGYTASPTVTAIDATGDGTGATFSATVSGGVITAINVLTQGAEYTAGLTTIEITDTTGSGAIAQPIITNIVSFTTSASVFTAGNVGDVIRLGNNNTAVLATNGVTNNGGGKAVITSYVSATSVRANIVEPITAVITDDPNSMPVPAVSGQWSLSTPTDVVSGLNHLEGMEVAILADGAVIANQTVTNGSITLPQEYSAIVVGLPFIAQVQTLYIEPSGEKATMQGDRKNITSIVMRVEGSRGWSTGTNQPDSSTQPNNAVVPWEGMVEVKQRNALIHAGNATPLATGDFYQNVEGNWSVYGQAAAQQIYPLPLNCLAMVISYQKGDTQT